MLKSIIFQISFVQDITQDTDYYMLIQFKMSATGYPSSVVQTGGVYPPFYGTCNYYDLEEKIWKLKKKIFK